MPDPIYVLSGETFDRHEEAADIVLGTSRSKISAPHSLVRRPQVHRALLITNGTPVQGRYAAKMQWRLDTDSPGVWQDFDPPGDGWAIGLNDEVLVLGQRYAGFMVSVNPDDAKAIFVVGISGGEGDGGFFARVSAADCNAGVWGLVELEALAGGTWQDRPGGISTSLAYHLAKGVGPYAGSGPLIQVGTRARAWKGKLNGSTQEYVFDCPAGFTGTKQYAKIVECAGVPPRLRVLYYYEQQWNGSTIKPPCWDPAVPICGTCPSDPPPPP